MHKKARIATGKGWNEELKCSGWVEQVRARLGGLGRIHETNLPYKIFLGKNYCMGWCDKLKWLQVREEIKMNSKQLAISGFLTALGWSLFFIGEYDYGITIFVGAMIIIALGKK